MKDVNRLAQQVKDGLFTYDRTCDYGRSSFQDCLDYMSDNELDYGCDGCGERREVLEALEDLRLAARGKCPFESGKVLNRNHVKTFDATWQCQIMAMRTPCSSER